ncbi:MAG: redox-sensing transcriptional repressor Rex [Spirochaetaceae bacterium]|nr:MAG: redox-sensing transcriptional repressor Rex [Spirochaetaceae bacterium]
MQNRTDTTRTIGEHGIPEPTLRRLPAYCQVLRRLAGRGLKQVSCTRIGRELGFDPTQVRKDLALAGAVGRPKVGYCTEELYRTLENFLGWNNVEEAVLVGVGHLGTALLGYTPFDRYGVRIVAAFDSDPEKLGPHAHGVQVFPQTRLPELLRRMKLRIGILTVPAEAAQSVCDLMTANGVIAIWNFAPIALSVPANVIVQNEDLFATLGVLSSKLAAALRTGS